MRRAIELVGKLLVYALLALLADLGIEQVSELLVYA
jgi:hypothetical protein